MRTLRPRRTRCLDAGGAGLARLLTNRYAGAAFLAYPSSDERLRPALGGQATQKGEEP